MSSAVSMARIRVSDALSAVAMLEHRLRNVSATTLEGNDILIDACAYRTGVIGEAIGYAKNLIPTVLARNQPSGFTWDVVIAVRNSFVHDYNKVNGKVMMMFASNLPQL